MAVQRSIIVIVIIAAHLQWVFPNPANQKSEARPATDSKAKLVNTRTNAKKTLAVVPTPFLPPTQSVSMKKIGVHLKSSKPKTFAFSNHRFSFRAPVISQSNLQLRTSPERKVPRQEVFAKQTIKRYEPLKSTKTIKSKITNLSNRNRGAMGLTQKINKASKLNEDRKTSGSSLKTESGTSESTGSGVTSQAIIDEQRRRQSRMGFSLQRVQSKTETENITNEKKSIKKSTKSDVTPALNTKEKVRTSKSNNLEKRKWMDKLTRSDTVQTPIRKEPTPQKSFSAKMFREIGPRPLTMSSRMAVMTKNIPAAAKTHTEEVSASTPRRTTENVIENKSKIESVPKVMKLTENAQLRQNSLIDKQQGMVKKSDLLTDMAKQIPLYIPLPPGEIFDRDLFLKTKPMHSPLPSEVKLKTERNHQQESISRPTTRTPEQNNFIKSIQDFKTKPKTAPNTNIYPQTVPKLKPLPRPVTNERIIESTLNQNIILPKPLSAEPKKISPSGIGIGVPLPITGNHEVSGTVPLRPASIPPPPPNDFVGGLIPRPPGPWTNTIQRPLLPPSPQNRMNPVNTPNRMIPINTPRRQSPNRVVQRNYVQTKVPLSGVIPQPPGIIPQPQGIIPNPPGINPQPQGIIPNPPGINPKPQGIIPNPPGINPKPQGIIPNPSGVIPQPPGMVLRENRIHHPPNVRTLSQQHMPNAPYLTKAPNKQNVQESQNHFVARLHHPPPNHNRGRHHVDRNLSRNQHQQTAHEFIDVTVPYDVTQQQPMTTTHKPAPGPRRRPPKPRNFDPLKHIMKGNKNQAKKPKKPTKTRKPPEPPERTTSADPERKTFNQKIFKNSFQKDYVNEQRGRHPLKEFMIEFERYMKNMETFFDLSGMMEFKR